jgi:HK97 gp10 family phage protein
MAEVTVKLEDWKGQKAKIQADKVINKTVFETAIIVRGQAVALSPVDSGRLRESLVIRMKNRDVGNPIQAEDDIPTPPDKNEANVGTNVNYAEYVEFGTKNQRAQPYMRPAFDLAKGRVLKIGIANGKKEFAEGQF